MAALRLTARGRDTLAAVARPHAGARETRRALALLDLGAGEPATRVARRSRGGRSTVHEWVARRTDAGRPRAERLRDAARPGRPATPRDATEEALAALLPTAPTDRGDRHPGWATPPLLAHLPRSGVAASDTTARRALHRLGCRWGRPRLVLSRRAEHRRQSEGGSGPG